MKCGLLPIATSSFPIYFSSSYQFLRYPSRDTVYRHGAVIRVSMTHNDVYIGLKEAELEMSKETTQIYHTQRMVLLAPSAKKNFPPKHITRRLHLEAKVKIFRICLLNTDKYNVLSQALQAYLERRWGPFKPASGHRTRGEWVILICETNNENNSNNNLSAPSKEEFLIWNGKSERNAYSPPKWHTSAYGNLTFSPKQIKHRETPWWGTRALRGRQGLWVVGATWEREVEGRELCCSAAGTILQFPCFFFNVSALHR